MRSWRNAKVLNIEEAYASMVVLRRVSHAEEYQDATGVNPWCFTCKLENRKFATPRPIFELRIFIFSEKSLTRCHCESPKDLWQSPEDTLLGRLLRRGIYPARLKGVAGLLAETRLFSSKIKILRTKQVFTPLKVFLNVRL